MPYPSRRILINCNICGTEKSIALSHYKKSKSKKFYCSHECGCIGSIRQIKTDCAYCGKELYIAPHRLGKNGKVFCSIECNSNFQKSNKIKVQCTWCGKSEMVHPCRSRGNHFCNKNCYAKWRSENFQGENNPKWKPKVVTSCAWCKRPLEVYPCNLEHNNYCDKECSTEWRKHNYSKDGNPNWNNGASYESYGLEFNESLKCKIRKRDNHCCINCGKVEYDGMDLHVHHIDYDKMNNDDGNLITLCNSCHSKSNFNKGYWKKYFNGILNLQRLSRKGVHRKPTAVEAQSILQNDKKRMMI